MLSWRTLFNPKSIQCLVEKNCLNLKSNQFVVGKTL